MFVISILIDQFILNNPVINNTPFNEIVDLYSTAIVLDNLIISASIDLFTIGPHTLVESVPQNLLVWLFLYLNCFLYKIKLKLFFYHYFKRVEVDVVWLYHL